MQRASAGRPSVSSFLGKGEKGWFSDHSKQTFFEISVWICLVQKMLDTPFFLSQWQQPILGLKHTKPSASLSSQYFRMIPLGGSLELMNFSNLQEDYRNYTPNFSASETLHSWGRVSNLFDVHPEALYKHEDLEATPHTNENLVWPAELLPRQIPVSFP